MAAPVKIDTTGTPAYLWTFTGIDVGSEGVAVGNEWRIYGPGENSGTAFSLKWQWSPDGGTNWFHIEDSETTDGNTGLKSSRMRPGIMRPIVDAHTAGTITAVLR